jgi:hypothetical protein
MWHIKDMDKITRDYTELGNGTINSRFFRRRSLPGSNITSWSRGEISGKPLWQASRKAQYTLTKICGFFEEKLGPVRSVSSSYLIVSILQNSFQKALLLPS